MAFWRRYFFASSNTRCSGASDVPVTLHTGIASGGTTSHARLALAAYQARPATPVPRRSSELPHQAARRNLLPTDEALRILLTLVLP